jgi:hypothetical protein
MKRISLRNLPTSRIPIGRVQPGHPAPEVPLVEGEMLKPILW